MLKEIQSNAFKSNDQIRPAIQFKKGLNVVKGPDDFVNSIGKSTFLMAVDFVFGGDDYVDKLKNVQKYVGEHDINFTFEFEKEYYFSRSTETPSLVTICIKGYIQTIEKWSINDYNKWLKDKYKIDNSLSIRQIVSRFFRIYNRENLDEQLPLRMYKEESEAKSIESIIKLFEMYGPIEKSNQEAKESEDRKSAFTDAQKFEYIPKINKTKYTSNIKRIEELNDQKNELAEKSSKNLLDLDSEKASVILKLSDELSTFKKQRGKLYYKLEKIKKDIQSESVNYQADFTVLKEFFPQVNEERLQTVELFHRDITNIMSSELKEAEKKTWNLVNLLNVQIKELENSIDKIQKVSHVSKVVLDEYAKIDKELNALKNENECYDKLNELDQVYKEKTGLLANDTMIQASYLQENLNAKMLDLNTKIFGINYNSPRISFISPKHYDFNTPDDDGTGTNFKGMILLDLACLALTCLPALVHDSVVLKQISKSSIEKIFELYSNVDEQIFISFDNVSSYTNRTIEIVDDKTVLYLSGGRNTLFDMQFGKKQGVAK